MFFQDTIKFVFTLSIFLTLKFIYSDAAAECQPYSVKSVDKLSFTVVSEEHIGRIKHWNGIKPQKYNIKLRFEEINETMNYEGMLSLKFKVVRATDKIIFNYNSVSLNVSLENITLKTISGDQLVCIKQVILSHKDDLIYIQADKHLNKGQEYLVTLHHFENVTEVRGFVQRDGITATLWGQRGARNLFPCLDHPALKANFNLCLVHQSNRQVVSNRKIYEQVKLRYEPKAEMMQSCFETISPEISTYQLSFSLMSNPQVFTTSVRNPQLTIYSSSTDGVHYSDNDFFDTVYMAIEAMENMTGYQYPLEKIDFVRIKSKYSLAVMEKLGLVYMRRKKPKAREIVYDIVHQWLGTLATVAYWDQICLVETLTAHLTKMILGTDKQYRPANIFYLKRPSIGPSHGVQELKKIKISYVGCVGSITSVFSSLTSIYGDNFIPNFLKQLFIQYIHNDFLYYNEYKRALDLAANTVDAGIIFDSYFVKAETPVLIIQSSGWNQIQIYYRYMHGESYTLKTLEKKEKPVPLPLKFMFYNMDNETVPENNEKLTDSITVYQAPCEFLNDSWYLFDPDGDLIATRIYDVRNYNNYAKWVINVTNGTCDPKAPDAHLCAAKAFEENGASYLRIELVMHHLCTFLEKFGKVFPQGFPMENDNATVKETKEAALNLMEVDTWLDDEGMMQGDCFLSILKYFIDVHNVAADTTQAAVATETTLPGVTAETTLAIGTAETTLASGTAETTLASGTAETTLASGTAETTLASRTAETTLGSVPGDTTPAETTLAGLAAVTMLAGVSAETTKAVLADKCHSYSVVSEKKLQFTISTEEQIGKRKDWNGIKPQHYNIELRFEEVNETLSYEGQLSLEFKVTTETNMIFFNYNSDSLNVSFGNITLETIGGAQSVCIKQVTLSPSQHLMYIEPDKDLRKGDRYLVTLHHFKNVTAVEGFVQIDGITTTLWEQRGARNLFPCLDHPALKANFTLCLVHPSNRRVVSNRNIYEQRHVDPRGEKMQTRFEIISPEISTYQLSFSIMSNPKIFTTRVRNPQLTIYSSFTNDVQYSDNDFFDTAYMAIEEMENMTGYQYPLEKIDFVRIIEKGSNLAAMEKLGLVNMGERKPKQNDIVYEIVHQWLGTLVTVSYWEQICLVESLTVILSKMILGTDITHRPANILFLTRPAIENDYDEIKLKKIKTKFIGCTGSVASIFTSLSAIYEDNFMSKFLKELFNQYKHNEFLYYNKYKQALEQAAGTLDAGLIFDSYFVNADTPVLIIQSSGLDQIQINYHYFHGKSYTLKTLEKNENPVPLPLKFLFYNMENEETSQNNEKLMDNITVYQAPSEFLNNSWYLFDPDGDLIAMRIYDVKNYNNYAKWVMNVTNITCDPNSIDAHICAAAAFEKNGASLLRVELVMYHLCKFFRYFAKLFPRGFPMENDNATLVETKEAAFNLLEVDKWFDPDGLMSGDDCFESILNYFVEVHKAP